MNAGVFTEGCVLATIASGFSKGYNFIILKDLVETADEKENQKFQEYLLKKLFSVLYGRVMIAKKFLEIKN